MSIIERLADILGPIPQPPPKPSADGRVGAAEADLIERAGRVDGAITPPQWKPTAADGGVDAVEPDLIERARSDKFQPSGFPVGQVRALDAEDKRAPVTGRVSRALNIDLDQLRRKNIMTPDAGRAPISESFRRIKQQILANVKDPIAESRTNLVMITSALLGEGKTFCTINLAISIAMEMDRTVLLVDADVARPSILRALGVEAERGLMDVLLDRSIDLGEVLWKTNIEKLSILPAGTQQRHATELLASETMRTLLHEMAHRYRDRIIIFDSPPLLVTSEAAVLATRMGQILMVVEANKTTEAQLNDALSRVGTSSVVGVLLNKGQPPGSSWSGYDGYGYGYGYGS